MDISAAIQDPELGYTAFTVERITYTRSRSGSTSRSVTTQASGCIHPGTPEMLQLLPEEERNETFIAIYTDYPLSTGTPEKPASSIVAAPHCGDGSFQITSPPNSPVTLSGGWIYNRVAKKGVHIEGKSGSIPLVDTGQLYSDFGYEIVPK